VHSHDFPSAVSRADRLPTPALPGSGLRSAATQPPSQPGLSELPLPS